MSEWVISVQDIITLSAIVAAIGVIWTFGKKPFDEMREINNSLDTLKEDMGELKSSVRLHGDMIYAILDHEATNNNTGGMKDALDKYNDAIRNG